MAEYKSFKVEVKNAIKGAEKETLEKIGFLIEAESKLRCPIDTGTLRRSINSKVNGSDSVSIGSNVEYALYVHEGTLTQKKQAFIKEAVDENISKIKDIAEKAMKKID